MILCSQCAQLVDKDKNFCPYCNNDLSYKKDIKAKQKQIDKELADYKNVELLTGRNISKKDLKKSELVIAEERTQDKVYETPKKIVIDNPFLNSSKEYKNHMENQKDISKSIKESAQEEVNEKLEEKIEAKIEAEMTEIDETTIPLALEETKTKESNKDNKNKKPAKKAKRKKQKYDKKIVKNVRSTIKEKPSKVLVADKAKGAAISQRAIEAFRLSPSIKRRLTKKERRNILLSSITASVLLVIAVIYLAYYSFYGNFETPIKSYYKGLNLASDQQILDSYPECIRVNLEFKSLINQLVLPMKNYPEANFRYEVVKKEVLSLDAIEKQQYDYDLTCGTGQMQITKGYTVTVNHYQKPNIHLDEIKQEVQIIVGQVAGKWYILE